MNTRFATFDEWVAVRADELRRTHKATDLIECPGCYGEGSQDCECCNNGSVNCSQCHGLGEVVFGDLDPAILAIHSDYLKAVVSDAELLAKWTNVDVSSVLVGGGFRVWMDWHKGISSRTLRIH